MYVFQKDDLKFREWARRLSDLGVRAAAVQGSPMWAPLVLLACRIRHGRISGYVFRYLNDYPSLLKTLLRFASEVAVILIVKTFRASIVWIAHNVDRESDRHHVRLSKFRRRFVSGAADVVFVTDPLLIEHARRSIPAARRLSWLCFGPPDLLPGNDETEALQLVIRRFRSELGRANPSAEVRIGLCVSSPASKVTHFLTVCDFVDRHRSSGHVIGVVVIGDIGRFTDPMYVAASERMRKHARVLLIDRAVAVREQYIADDIDFVYRVMNDQSVPFSLYVAAATGKPIVTEAGTFLAEMVEAYELGYVVPEDLGDCDGAERLVEKLRCWNGETAVRFLEQRNWWTAARQFAASVTECQARGAWFPLGSPATVVRDCKEMNE